MSSIETSRNFNCEISHTTTQWCIYRSCDKQYAGCICVLPRRTPVQEEGRLPEKQMLILTRLPGGLRPIAGVLQTFSPAFQVSQSVHQAHTHHSSRCSNSFPPVGSANRCGKKTTRWGTQYSSRRQSRPGFSHSAMAVNVFRQCKVYLSSTWFHRLDSP